MRLGRVGLAECQRFGLRQDVGNQDIVVAAKRVYGLTEGQEIAGNSRVP